MKASFVPAAALVVLLGITGCGSAVDASKQQACEEISLAASNFLDKAGQSTFFTDPERAKAELDEVLKVTGAHADLVPRYHRAIQSFRDALPADPFNQTPEEAAYFSAATSDLERGIEEVSQVCPGY
ncbi:hypothetical protein ICL81_04560 [Leucobacter sp. cx-328]|uniref:hypothetical protein n=1 Tax=unclassified Leucobacter TaxID=2621730 RepID=UPI00165E0E6E|nr:MULTISPECIES: hypothetical protein [unclassified Leucobacter]MBC9943798.1 hypothetical protein [Leucobacter sp. cx-328]